MLYQGKIVPPGAEEFLRRVAQRTIEQHDEDLARARGEEAPEVSEAEQAELNARVRLATKDELTWLRGYTLTENPHWMEEGRPGPFEPFPDWEYFEPIFEFLNDPTEKVKPIKKSRDMMVTWAIMGYFTLQAMKVPARQVVVQTMEQEKAEECIGYAKCLYRHQPDWLRNAFPLAKPLERMAAGELTFLNGSTIWGIPGGKGKLRTYHPWAYFSDEAAFQIEAGECFDEALSACQKIVINSTAWPGWFFDWLNDIQI